MNTTEFFENWGGPFFAFLSSCTWAVGSSTYSRLALRHPPFSINFTRAALAFPLFLICALLSHPEGMNGALFFSQITVSEWGWITLSMICSYALGDALFVWSTRSLGIPGALAIASSYPIWTVFYGFVFREEIPSFQNLLGLALALIGIGAVILSAPRVSPLQKKTEGSFEARRNLPVGVGLAVLTSLMWALNSVSIARAGSTLNVFQVNTVRMFLGLFLCFGLGKLYQSRSQADSAKVREIYLSYRSLKPYIWIFVLEAFGGSLFFTYGLTHSPLVIASTLSSLAPVLAVPVSWALRLEKPNVVRTGAVFTVVFGLYLLIR